MDFNGLNKDLPILHHWKRKLKQKEKENFTNSGFIISTFC